VFVLVSMTAGLLAAGGVRLGPRPPLLVVATALGGAGLTLAALFLALGRSRSMLGRPLGILLLASVCLPAALLTWKSYLSALFPEMDAPWPGRPGLRCLGLGVALSLVPLFSALVARRGSQVVHPGAGGAAIGVAAGMAAFVFVDLWCPVGFLPHLLLGHLLPIVIAVLLGALVGPRLLAPS
jgi:hypothetical protein